MIEMNFLRLYDNKFKYILDNIFHYRRYVIVGEDIESIKRRLMINDVKYKQTASIKVTRKDLHNPYTFVFIKIKEKYRKNTYKAAKQIYDGCLLARHGEFTYVCDIIFSNVIGNYKDERIPEKVREENNCLIEKGWDWYNIKEDDIV